MIFTADLAAKLKTLIMKIENYEIRQDGKTILSGDELSLKMVFNNMTGKNLSGQEYEKYKSFIEGEGFDLNKTFALYNNGSFIKTGQFV